MTALIDRYTLGVVSRQVTDIVAAYLVFLIAYGGEISGAGDVVALAQVILAIKLHIFAIPLAWTPVFGQVPLWGWYVAVVLWLMRFVARSGYTTEEIVQQFEEHLESGTPSPSPQAEPVPDGGETPSEVNDAG